MPSGLITIAQARELVLQSTRPLAPPELIEVDHALDRVLAQDVAAAGDVPPFPCSAMDGYAVTAGPAGRVLTVFGESRAGAPSERPVENGQATRISTGAAIPPGASAVIPQENVEVRDGTITTTAPVREGEHVRHAGEDIPAGTTVLAAGSRLRAAELGAAVASGLGRVLVARRPRVQVLCTGDELRPPGEPLGPGEIHNSNALMLVALAARCGAVAPAAGRLPDDRAATVEALAAALDHADVTIVSGGVSVGPHDHVKPALAQLQVEEVFWGVSLQPGKPTWFGVRDDRLVFGLPGNPVSAFVTFTLFASHALAALQGTTVAPALEPEAILAMAVHRHNREQAVRVKLERRDGAMVAVPNGPQGSHIITSLLGADALALIPPGSGEMPAGASVALEPLPG
ncbi:MAG: molybdopterin molybdotransferase MoeA [Solirubrobacterales bacterium]|nr:molybdopterin molybdotransferase MoeA [Solirubrobacterales bacterium]